MNEFCLHPRVYSTGNARNLVNMLEHVWVRNCRLGEGTLYIVSGFGNYNGGVRFYPVFRKHITAGGRVVAYFSGSTSQRLTSQEVVEELLQCGAEVNVVNRKRMLHAKFYGKQHEERRSLVVSSGNFTGPGMAQNVEASLMLDEDTTANLGFAWNEVVDAIELQGWQVYELSLDERDGPGWELLFNETAAEIVLDESDEITLVVTLGHSDTARIRARPGSSASRGTQYFWLSKDCYDFFPPLTIRNRRGYKATFSTIINLYYRDLDLTDDRCRVTFEAENNLDFRLGTGKLRSTRLANRGDIGAITRKGERDYELRLFRAGTREHEALLPFATTFVGHRGKRTGYIPNQKLEEIV